MLAGVVASDIAVTSRRVPGITCECRLGITCRNFVSSFGTWVRAGCLEYASLLTDPKRIAGLDDVAAACVGGRPDLDDGDHDDENQEWNANEQA
jgi:hypothetical protein